MNILIVGGAGYIGSHIVKYLTGQSKYQVIVLDNLSRGHRGAVLDAELVWEISVISALVTRFAVSGISPD